MGRAEAKDVAKKEGDRMMGALHFESVCTETPVLKKVLFCGMN